jgi:hypothetical protein
MLPDKQIGIFCTQKHTANHRSTFSANHILQHGNFKSDVTDNTRQKICL